MVKTQIQIPDELYRKAKRIAKERELSFAEVARRGLEYITSTYPARIEEDWTLPVVNEGQPPTLTRDDISRALEEERERSI